MDWFKTIHGFLSRPKGFFEPRSLEVGVTVGYDGGKLFLEFGYMPRVILVTDRLLHQWDPEAPTLEELGYVMYDKSIIMLASYYARRPWVWLLKTRVWVVCQCWRFIHWVQRWRKC